MAPLSQNCPPPQDMKPDLLNWGLPRLHVLRRPLPQELGIRKESGHSGCDRADFQSERPLLSSPARERSTGEP